MILITFRGSFKGLCLLKGAYEKAPLTFHDPSSTNTKVSVNKSAKYLLITFIAKTFVAEIIYS